jgi:hypothetical protein
MKYLKRFNESVDSGKKIQIGGKKRYSNISYAYRDGSLFISSDPNKRVISFETADKGVDISDPVKIDQIIDFLMEEKDKLM